MTRQVGEGFTRGSVLLEKTSLEGDTEKDNSLLVEFENENLLAILRTKDREDKVLACCPDLITVFGILDLCIKICADIILLVPRYGQWCSSWHIRL